MKLKERQTRFQQQVVARFDELPPQQQAIARYLLDHLREVPFLSVPELARRSGTSEATIVRFAQRVGYDGFSALKMDLLEALRDQVVDGAPAAAGGALEAAEEGTLAAVARQAVRNIQRTVEELDDGELGRMAAALFRADHVFAFGLGISAHLAELAAYLLAQIGLRASVLSARFSSPLEQVVALRPTDLLLVFSFPPYSKRTLDLVREAAGQGVPTACFCDRPTAPVARLADLALPVPGESMMFTNSIDAVVVVLNALVTEIALRHGDHAVEAVARINRILGDDEELIE